MQEETKSVDPPLRMILDIPTGQKRESETMMTSGMLKQRTDWVTLVLPWIGVVALACVWSVGSSFLEMINDDVMESEPSHIRRSILETSSAPPIYNEEHAALFPLTRSDMYGFTLAVLGLMVAAGGGIGGGGILVPIYILIFGFSPKHAIPLSNITVFGGAIANTYLNSKKRHPLADRPLVDWDLILVMEPLTIAGALLGAFLNKLLPELLLTVLLVLLLSFTANTTLRKATKMYKAETRALRAASKESELTRMAAQEADDEKEAGDKLLDNMEEQEVAEEGSGDDAKQKSADAVEKTPVVNEELQNILEEEKLIPSTNLKILITLFVVVLAINLLKGGGAFKSPIGITCGSPMFWVSNVAMLLWILGISVYVRNILLKKHEAKERCKFEYVQGDIKWDGKATIVYPVVCCLAGFFAGMFGVDYAVVCLLVGFLATLVGQIGLSYVMKRAQRNSYIAFSIGAVVLLSAFLMTIQSLLSMATGEQHHAGGICGKGD